MKYGIENTLNVVTHFGELTTAAISIAKGGIGISSARNILAIVGDLKAIAVSVKDCLPEVKDLDSEEKMQLLQALTDILTQIAEKVIE